MTAWRSVKIILLASVLGSIGPEALHWLTAPGSHGAHGLIQAAEARVGRPLTPVSVAGVARRSVRRCAVGVYNC